MGSCNLHSLHSALKSGSKETRYEFKSIMKEAFQLLY